MSAVAAAEVFEPARLGPVELRNRVIKAATFEGMTPHGLVTDELIEFHLRPARGGVGMTTVAYCAAASAADLHRITHAHAEAALMAREAGFDAVELHFGHNYLVSSFLSPRLNRRTDEFGGSLANRARLARDIAQAVRDAVGGQLAIIAKLNMDDGVPGGFWLDESIQVARWLEADGTIDALELTTGSSLLNPMYLFTGDAPVREFAAQFPAPIRLAIQLTGSRFLRSYPYQEAYLLDRARQFRDALNLPLILLGGITRRQTMDLAMAEGFAFVAMARALLREPDLLHRIRSDPRARSLCIHCNKCMPTIYSGTHCVLATPPRT